MATQTFNLTGVGNQDSTALTVGAGEKLRVRFTAVTGLPNIYLEIAANSVTQYVPIHERTAWVTDAVLGGDVVKVRMRGNSSTDNVTGIIETGA